MEGKQVVVPVLNPVTVRSRSVTGKAPKLSNSSLAPIRGCRTGALTFTEHVLAGFHRVVHVVLDLSTFAFWCIATVLVGQGGRGVAHFVALRGAVAFRGAAVRVGKVCHGEGGVHLVGHRLVEFTARLQFAHRTKSL